MDRFIKGRVVGLDTTPLIYFIEKHPDYVNIIRSFFKSVENGECEVVTSTITLLETLVRPLKLGDKYLVEKYRTILLRTKGLKTVPVSTEIAEAAASLRAKHNMHIADSIEMATAIKSGASFFLTNDLALPSLPNLKVLTLEALKKDSNSETAK